VSDDLTPRILERSARAGAVASPELAGAAAAYLALLARWNRTINLTGFDLTAVSDEAIDRLIVEPFAAATHFRPTDRRVIDVGSGGGSPALLLKLARPDLEFVLIESKARKSAFLREAVRHLGLSGVRVEQARSTEVADRDEVRAWADVVTVRAVRLDAEGLKEFASLLAPEGRVWVFCGDDRGFSGASHFPLGTERPSRLVVLPRGNLVL
jgi:16S rRNA (guanine527-N7)-methyltransferase